MNSKFRILMENLINLFWSEHILLSSCSCSFFQPLREMLTTSLVVKSSNDALEQHRKWNCPLKCWSTWSMTAVKMHHFKTSEIHGFWSMNLKDPLDSSLIQILRNHGQHCFSKVPVVYWTGYHIRVLGDHLFNTLPYSDGIYPISSDQTIFERQEVKENYNYLW